MDKMEMAKAGNELIGIADMVRDKLRRGFTVEEVKKIRPDIEESVIELAAKFLAEIKAARLGKALIMCAILAVTSGCLPALGDMPATGWRVSFGVDPIDGLSDTRKLDQVQRSHVQNAKY